jgi:hypothetical protein
MPQPDARNPEHRSNNSMLLFCTGIGLCIVSYFLGIGAVIGVAATGGDPAVVIGSMLGVIGVVLMGIVGAIMALIGGIWMIVRVIADQTGDDSRYRDVER